MDEQQASQAIDEKVIWRSEDHQTTIFIVGGKALCIQHGGRGITKPFDMWIKDNWSNPDPSLAVA